MGFRGSRVQIPPSRLAPAKSGGESFRRDFANAARFARGFLVKSRRPDSISGWSRGLPASQSLRIAVGQPERKNGTATNLARNGDVPAK